LSYQVELAPAAVRQLKKFTPDVRRRIQGVLELLADDPRPPAATQLVVGSGEWRVRTGDYRVIYEIHEQQVLVLVLRIGHRQDVHDR
jgi:mRNA interferase RelE/StbE